MAPARMAASAPSSPSGPAAALEVDWSADRPAIHDAARGQRAPQHDEAALRVHGRVERVDDHAVGARRVELGEVLGHRAAGHREDIAVEQPGLEQVLHHDGDAADPVEVGHVELAARLHVGDVGHAGGDAVEVVQIEGDPGLVGDGQQVEDGVGRAAEGVGDRDGVLERSLRHDLTGRDAQPEQPDDGLAGAHRVVVAAAVDRGGRRRAGQRHAERLTDRGHGVGREHATAGALARTGLALDLAEVVLRDEPAHALPRSLVMSSGAVVVAGEDGAGVTKTIGGRAGPRP